VLLVRVSSSARACRSCAFRSYDVEQVVNEAGHRGASCRGLWSEGQDQGVINFNRVGAIDGNSRLVELRHRSSDSEVNTVFNVAQCDGLPEKIIKGSYLQDWQRRSARCTIHAGPIRHAV
jgi:hypothetical protein